MEHSDPDANGLRPDEDMCRILSLAVEQSTEGIAIADMGGNLTYVNEAFAAMHGYSPGELAGKHLSIFHTPEQIPAVDEANLQLEKTGKFSGEIWHVRRDGTPFPTFMNNYILRDKGGSAIGIIGTLRDIAERKRVEKALWESEKRFKQVAENAGEWIWEVDADGLYTYASPAVERILGFTPEEIVGRKHFYDLIHHEEREDIKKESLEVFAQKKPFHGFINRNAHKNGAEVILETSGVPILDENGKLLGYRGTDTDITERKRAEDELKQYRSQLEEMVEKRTEELNRVNEDLLFEINGRKKIEKELRDSEERLTEQKESLEEKNVALREILEQLGVEKKKFKDDIVANIENLVIPVLRKLETEEGQFKQEYLTLLKRNLEELATSFGSKLSEPRLRLTPREIEVCDMIKTGLSTKDIAKMLHLSKKTVEKHRDNIRRKLDITNRAINLSTYLQTM